jgi:hypothetical protein
VHFQVVPGRMLTMLGRVQMMRMRYVRMVGGLLVVSGLVRLSGFGVVMGGLRVVMGRLMVVVDCLL